MAGLQRTDIHGNHMALGFLLLPTTFKAPFGELYVYRCCQDKKNKEPSHVLSSFERHLGQGKPREAFFGGSTVGKLETWEALYGLFWDFSKTSQT